MYHYYINKICYGLHTVIKINTESFQYLADIGLYTCMVKRSKSKNPSTCILKHIFLVKICDFFFHFHASKPIRPRTLNIEWMSIHVSIFSVSFELNWVELKYHSWYLMQLNIFVDSHSRTMHLICIIDFLKHIWWLWMVLMHGKIEN